MELLYSYPHERMNVQQIAAFWDAERNMSMELWEQEVILSMSFPKESVDQLDVTDEGMQKFLENNPDIKRSASFTFKEQV